MTERAANPSASPAPASRAGGEWAKSLAILLAVCLAVGLFYLLGARRPIERSAIGLAGLERWLETSGVPTVPAFQGGPGAQSFRILPVYDPKLLGEGVEQADGGEDERGALSPQPLARADFVARATAGPMLAVLPKWRGGMVARGAAHPDLLVPPGAMDFFGGEPVRRLAEKGLATYKVYDKEFGQPVSRPATLYSAQVLGQGLEAKCNPVLVLEDDRGDPLGTLMADCTGKLFEGSGNTLFVLSDPDVLDNAGLALGDNAGLALTIVEGFAGNSAIFVDADTASEAVQGATQPEGGEDRRQRTLADLDRFFVYPFSWFWIGVVLVTGLALWRGSRRFGRPQEEVEAAEASKRRTIEASRRILLLSREDEPLVARHVADRIEALASALVETTRRDRSGELAALSRLLARRSPELASRFHKAHAAVTATGLKERARFDALAAFEAVIQETWHEFGRVAGPARPDRR
ncbi:hypothetical protein [Jiella sonneratiae]|uniref:DUF4350 domain-containing protein n=1 Tax=Jiella sonneratiae TaxID=2816856 RepID=A0ABS3JAB5_9HYPH|nr:hypothetical protein [Jiella sonneratiae]MBO0905501.1 hypothetical protein [Jiella sonneratiae]